MKALILRNGHLGDIILTSSLIRPLIKLGYERIDWVSNNRILEMQPWLPRCEKCFVLAPKPDVIFQGAVIRRIRREKYDLLLIIEQSSKYYPLVWIAGARKVAALNTRKFLKFGIDFFWHWNKSLSDTKNYGELVRRINPEIQETEKLMLAAPDNPFSGRQLRWINGMPSNYQNVVIHPGTSMPEIRGYPFSQYKLLIKSMIEKHENLRIILSGNNHELEHFNNTFKQHPGRVIPFFGDFSINELCGLIYWSDLLISTDTGPMHIACALGKPQVVLYGPTSYEHTGPACNSNALIIQANYPCCPCIYEEDQTEKDRCRKLGHPRCYETLSPETILGEIRKRWGDADNLIRADKLPNSSLAS